MAKPGRIHIVIPDTQVKPDVPLDHLGWIGRYIVDEYAGADLAVIHLGDHWDLPSLSSYDKGKRCMEGRRVKADVLVGNKALAMLTTEKGSWIPNRYLLTGNHEDRLRRLGELDPQLDGVLPELATSGWKVIPYLKPLYLDGVGYSHYWYNPLTGRPYTGMAESRLRQIGHSFTMGHQQTLQYGVRFVAGKSQHALIAGACYLHDEEYKGPQGNAHWRGVIVCHNVREGSYDPMFVSLDYLARRYTGKALGKFLT